MMVWGSIVPWHGPNPVISDEDGWMVGAGGGTHIPFCFRFESENSRLPLSVYGCALLPWMMGYQACTALTWTISLKGKVTKRYTPADTRTRKPKGLEQYGVSVKGGFAFIYFSRQCAP